jgi:hypothetical protein
MVNLCAPEQHSFSFDTHFTKMYVKEEVWNKTDGRNATRLRLRVRLYLAADFYSS